MEIYFDKLEQFLKQKKLKYKDVYQMAGVCKATFWKWKRGDSVPKEINILNISRGLNIPASKFSDITDDNLVSNIQLSKGIGPIRHLIDNNKYINEHEFNIIHTKVDIIQKMLNQTAMIIKGLTNVEHLIFYLKDINLEYILANKGFIKNLKLNKNYDVTGKTDKDFFSIKEASINELEDKKVLLTGKPIINKEEYIPGSRKRKWGLISKYPVFDYENKVEGIFTVHVDITDRIKEERTRELLDIHINAMSTGIVILDIEKRKYLYMNKCIEEITGYSIEHLIKLNPNDFSRLIFHPDDIKDETFDDVYMSSDYKKKSQYRVINKDGTVKYITVTRDRTNYRNRNCTINLIKKKEVFE